MRTTPVRSFHHAPLLASASALAWSALACPAHAGASDADTRQAVLDCTFELVSQMRGPAEGASEDLAARAAPPLVRVAGTAFCFGNGELATAAHVFDQVLGSRFEAPVIRDRAGRTYPVDRILRYSMRDDFVVFTASGLPPLAARPHGTVEEPDAYTKSGRTLHLAWRRADRDIAFGNTRYRGRSTVENLGRDGWIQFGPAPGHGASGAALLDDAGRVVGLINSRSSERPDADAFAVPIELVERASTEWADIAMRDPLRTLGMPSERNMPLVGGIPLPAAYSRFEQHMVEVRKTYFAHMLPYSLSLSGSGAPMSDVQRAQLCAALEPGYCAPGRSSVTTPVRNGAGNTAFRSDRRGRGCAVTWTGVGAALIRCHTRAELAPARIADDARGLTAVASIGRRVVQAPPAPCTNADPLEEVAATDSFADHTGSEWQVHARPVRGCDWVVVSMSRAVVDGTLAFVRGAPSAYADAAAMQLKALASTQCESCNASGEETVLAGVREVQGEAAR